MIQHIVSSIGEFSYRYRKPIMICAVILFIAVIILQSQAVIEYSYAEESVVTDIFPQDDTVVIVYDNHDEGKIKEIISFLEKDEHVTSIQAYANTLGLEMSTAEIAGMMGIDEVFVNTLFYIHEYGMATTGMTLVDFVSFISSDDFMNNELFSPMIDEDSKAQIMQMKSLIDALASEEEYSAAEISEFLGVEEKLVKMVIYITQIKNMDIKNASSTIFGIFAGIVGMDQNILDRYFNITIDDTIKFSEFVDTIAELASFVQGIIDSEQLDQLMMLKDMSKMVRENRSLQPNDLAELFSAAAGDNDMFNEGNLTLLYIMSRSNTMDMSDTKIPLYDFFMFLSKEILKNDAFSSFFDDSVAEQFNEAKTMMEDGKAQLIGPQHSRFIITLDYPLESKEIYAFYEGFTEKLDSTLKMDYYLVGASAMSYELSHSFRTENLIISIVTAISVFIVVWITFKKFSISALLICIIECAVFAMMSVMTISGEPMFFIALILVQCILMGSMIDYGILFTTYYTEVRKEYTIDKALPEVMRRATHAILTSSLIIILVTLVCSNFMTGAVASILKTLGIGALCAILLILFVLPSLLVIFDKYFIKDAPEYLEDTEE